MEHPFFTQATCAVFLLLMGAARYYYSASASRQPADSAGPAGDWVRHLPAYFTSSTWTVYVAWRVINPMPPAGWDSWALAHPVSDWLGLAAIPVLIAGFSLFWYSHYTIGRYWNIRIRMKHAHRLVTNGPYNYIRHPLYTALFLGYLGTLLALQSWLLAAWFPLFIASYLLFVKEEENVMERRFGETYRAYRCQTGMFFPEWPKLLVDMQRAAARWDARGSNKRPVSVNTDCKEPPS